MQVLTTVRSLLEERLERKEALELFAPEFRLDNLSRLAEGESVISLARIRAEEEEACLEHDARFIASSSAGAVEGEVLAGLAQQRHQLVCTLLHDVLTMLRNAPGISEALVTVGRGDAAVGVKRCPPLGRGTKLSTHNILERRRRGRCRRRCRHRCGSVSD